ncbi:MAG: hypothetical protein KQJ78_17075 [Deltaproteobacteria bacterium]|nr:hypothetical protein [Deltaproteobacteria bacterium]
MLSTTTAKISFFGIPALILLVVLSGIYEPLSAWSWQQIPLHSSMETIGGIVALLISTILFWEAKNRTETHLVLVATGFATMGVLDTAHAMSRPGDAFIFLHSVASLTCGFFFASIWFAYGRRLAGRFEQFFIFFGAIFLAVTIALRALLFPGDVPKIMPLFSGKFTMAAVLINAVASLFYLVSIPKFYQVYRQEHRPEYLMFACLASLFGLSELIFMFSSPWDGVWWSWHLIRLAAFLAILGFVILQYRNNLAAGVLETGREGGGGHS